VRVATFNIRHGLGTDGRVRLDRIVRTVGAAAPSILCLQEVERWVWRSAFRRQDLRLAARLGMASAFGPSDRVGIVGHAGNAVLVAGTIESSTVLRLPPARLGPPRSALIAEVVVADRRLHVVVAHLAVGRADATAQLEALVERAAVLDGPVVVAGDLNLGVRDVRAVVGGHDFALAEAAATFPSDAPRVQIDHLAVRGGGIGGPEVLGGEGSDHLCLVADCSI
jgi:endonuclease/exonuclease/phosphatase family metal-dependent hydrolase